MTAEVDGKDMCRRPDCGHPRRQHDNLGCHANVSPQALIDYDPTQATAECDCRAFSGDEEAEHKCFFGEEREPSGRLILPPCFVCGLTAMDAIGQMRDGVYAIHHPVPVWTDTVVYNGEEQQVALYDDAGALIAATDVRTVCEGCDVRNDVPWPCPTAQAVGF